MTEFFARNWCKCVAAVIVAV